MYVETCPYHKKLDHTINVMRDEERENIKKEGENIAVLSGKHFEGCFFVTEEPYSLEKALPILYFD